MSSLLSILTGLNKETFLYLNRTLGLEQFNDFAILVDKIGGPHIFHYHFLFIMVIAAILLFHKRNSKQEIKELLILGITALLTLFLSIVINLVIIVNALKYLIAFERPFCSLENIYVIKKITKDISCARSFPSGHMSFTIILIASFWKILNKFFKCIAIIFIALVGLSRIISGAHYPMDIIGAILICLPVTFIIGHKIDQLIRYYESRWAIFDYLCRKIKI